MKRILLFAIGLFILNNVYAQTCLPDGITFNSQEAVDNFASNYPGCTSIEGDVIINENVIKYNGDDRVESCRSCLADEEA